MRATKAFLSRSMRSYSASYRAATRMTAGGAGGAGGAAAAAAFDEPDASAGGGGGASCSVAGYLLAIEVVKATALARRRSWASLS